ncbi:unnamed protein product [Caenorhabditis angaria]|uniref:Uncharacterized protein n=1 Tax=Caenorhabditis angaria TaxID=860376 RepID=A0A9P1ILC3_9PELO|nr:unnamed protein product [Caenorhabditis angaria]
MEDFEIAVWKRKWKNDCMNHSLRLGFAYSTLCLAYIIMLPILLSAWCEMYLDIYHDTTKFPSILVFTVYTINITLLLHTATNYFISYFDYCSTFLIYNCCYIHWILIHFIISGIVFLYDHERKVWLTNEARTIVLIIIAIFHLCLTAYSDWFLDKYCAS